uniref:Paraspol crystal protein n=1 Tax=Bacillus thuringiensis TaxID=1428 RepID=Q45727_BACTU|nr:paraspol crystal protein [Bacillus thuringiensis serovar cameroun]
MVREYPDLDSMIREAAQKWSEDNGLQFQKVSFKDPFTNRDTIRMSVKFKDIGCPEECLETETVKLSQAFTNNTGQPKKETVNTVTYVENQLTWENDFHFKLPGQNFLILPRIPQSVRMDINPGFLVNFFGDNELFSTNMRDRRPIQADVFVEPGSSAAIQLKVEKLHVTQPYEIELSILGSIIVTAQGAERYVDVTDLLPFLCLSKNLSSRGRALIFLEQGTFKGILNRKIRGYALQTRHCDGKTIEYEIPLNNRPPVSARPLNPATTAQQSRKTNDSSCGCSSDRPPVGIYLLSTIESNNLFSATEADEGCRFIMWMCCLFVCIK